MQNSSPGKSKQKTVSYIKQVVINLANTELTEEQKSLLNLGPNIQQLNLYPSWTLFWLQKHVQLI